ncbi:MAG: alpha/beta fold hydrolase [Dehalococcoidia bacterium]
MPIAKINGIGLYYEVHGEGFPIVFAHGYTGSHADWASQVSALSGKFRVVTMDHRGHGKSQAPSSASDYSVAIMAEDIYRLLQHLAIDTCCLVGHSMGGFMALQLALDHPAAVSALVLVDTSSGEFERVPGYDELRAKLDELARTQGMDVAFQYNAEHNPWMRERFEKHPELREISRQKMLQTSVDGYVHCAQAIANWPPVTARLSEIRVPTLIFLGDEDTPFIRPSQTMKEAIAGAKLVVVPGAGHSPHEEAPEAFNQALIDFLDGLRLGAA